MSAPVAARPAATPVPATLPVGTGSRLLQLDSALGGALLPLRCRVVEAVCDGFEARVDLLVAPGARLDALLGCTATLRLLQSDGRYRGWNGLVVETRTERGSRPRQGRLTLRPWTALLGLRPGCEVFPDATALEIVERVLARWPQACWRADVARELAVRPRRVQYGETDWAFCRRVLADEGLAWHVEQPDRDEATTDEPPGHVLVVTDEDAPRRRLGAVRFAAEHPTARLPGQRDAISAFEIGHSARPSCVDVGSWSPADLTLHAARVAADAPGPAALHRDWRGVGRFGDAEAAAGAAGRLLRAFDLGRCGARGRGSARHLAAGAVFELVGAPRGDGCWTLLRVEHEAANNLGADLARELRAGDVERGRYRNRFDAVPAGTPLVPPPTRAGAAGPQLATVVGVEHGLPATDRGLRVKLRHGWETPPPAAAGVTAAPWPARAATAAGAWVRVAQPSAGSNWGTVFVPRVGAEVLVAFDDGDRDRPVVVGALFNGRDRPPYAAGAGSGADHPGALSGVVSVAAATGGALAGEWVVDDTRGGVRMRLSCVPTPAELSIGRIVGQRPGDTRRGAVRGVGFELATAGWATLRAGHGLLVTTHRRAARGGSADGAQMDAQEPAARVDAGRDRLARAAAAAARAGAPLPAACAGGEPLDGALAAIAPDAARPRAATVSATGGVAGGAASVAASPVPSPASAGGTGATAGTDAADGTDATDGTDGAATAAPGFRAPWLVLAAESALVAGSDAAIVHAAGGDQLSVVGGRAVEAAVECATFATGGAWRACALGGRLDVVAGGGELSLAAHADAAEILADRDVRIESTAGELRLVAKRRIELSAGGSALVLDGADIRLTTPGRLELRSAVQRFTGPARVDARLSELAPPRSAGQAPGAAAHPLSL